MDTRTKVGAQVTQELLELLDPIFPNQCPSPGTTMDDIWFAAGQASVVQFLRAAHEESSANPLE